MAIQPLLICLSLVIAQIADAQDQPNSLLLTNVRVLDVNRGTLTGPTRIHISGNRIEAIGSELTIEPGDGTELTTRV